MELTLLDDLLGNFEIQNFVITKPDGSDGTIQVKPLTVDELHAAIISSKKLLRDEKRTDAESTIQYQNYCLIAASVVEPKMTVADIKRLPISVYTQLVDIVYKLTTVNPLDKKK